MQLADRIVAITVDRPDADNARSPSRATSSSTCSTLAGDICPRRSQEPNQGGHPTEEMTLTAQTSAGEHRAFARRFERA
jgi:hypothetical protein